jgi:uncharacterized membrane protein YdbT with pleckstrin-like domain
MAFSKKLLNDYETVALDLHPHWWYFAEPAFSLAGAIVIGILGVSVDGAVGDATGWLGTALIVGCAVWLVVRYLKWVTTNFVITSDRLIFREGVIAKHGIEIPLERVNNVNFSQSIFERMVGAGDLMIESGGEDGRSRFTDIRHPEKVQNLIHSQMEVNEQRRGVNHAGPAPVHGTIDVVSQLEKLEGLLHRGTITSFEFDSQKRRLLGPEAGGFPPPPTPPPSADR